MSAVTGSSRQCGEQYARNRVHPGYGRLRFLAIADLGRLMQNVGHRG
jgi:hypothetical protein